MFSSVMLLQNVKNDNEPGLKVIKHFHAHLN